MMNNRLKNAITLHDTLHGFTQGRGAGMVTMEAKLDQQLERIFHKPLFQVFIDVRKAYYSLDRGRSMEILWGYVLGPIL